jgi:hypothetical protein
MHHSFLKLAALALISTANDAQAFSKGFDQEGMVIMKDGVPCFYSDPFKDDAKINELGGISVSSLESGKRTELWSTDTSIGLNAPSPFTKEACIKYGTAPWRSPPKQLKEGIAHQVRFSVMGDYIVYFCLGKDPKGQTILTKPTGRGGCTQIPLDAPEPSFWQRLFAK